ncbi:uncharacterized protein LOC130798979 [Amaranthus tricolor]|uniref:uncharacterized protein LOC130798979 n=1 Tax=Amaranthus tricolor TaxID=29722 RepID=UPI00258B62DD|nr:uncharacterized protein LOC130798979 [Amaranthus tricolor]
MVSPIPTSVLASGRYTALLSQPLKEGNQTGNNYLVLRLPLGIKIALSTSIVALIFLVYWVWKCFGIKCELSVKHGRENGGTTHTSRAGIELSERVNDETDNPEENNSDEQCRNEDDVFSITVLDS